MLSRSSAGLAAFKLAWFIGGTGQSEFLTVEWDTFGFDFGEGLYVMPEPGKKPADLPREGTRCSEAEPPYTLLGGREFRRSLKFVPVGDQGVLPDSL